jgi:hypothetical protein
MTKSHKIIWLILVGLYFGLSSFIAIATQVSAPPAQAAKSAWPILTLEVINTTPQPLSANQIFPRDVVLEFPDVTPSQQSRTFKFTMIGGNLRGFVYLYVKGQPAATRLSFDGKTLKVQEFMGQSLSIDLQGGDCVSMDGNPACVWVGNADVNIKVIAKYTNRSPR